MRAFSSLAIANGAFSLTALTVKPCGQLGDAVAVAHPDGIALADLPDAVEQRARLDDVDLGAAELGGVSAFDCAAELYGRRLLAVADRRGSAGPT